MKTTFKTLSFVFFVSLLLLVFPLHSPAGEETSIQTKDIQILVYNEELRVSEIINVSIEDIKERLLKGKTVNFVKDQEDRKREIKPEWITNALKIEDGVEKIDIKNAIITGDLDFRIKEKLIDIENSGIEEELLEQLIVNNVKRTYVILPSVRMESCQLKGSIQAGYDCRFNANVIFENDFKFSIYFADNDSYFADNDSYLGKATIDGDMNFSKAVFNKFTNFSRATYNGYQHFCSHIFY